MDHLALLRLLQICDSAFPTGAFSHSQGFEAFHAAGELYSAEDLARLLRMQLSASATSDCVALAAACRATGAEEVAHADRLLSATRLTRELRSASEATGRRFLASVAALGVEGDVMEDFRRLVDEDETAANLAVCYGVAAPAMDVTLPDALHAYLYTSAASLVAAGQKLVPLGGSTAQRVLYEAGPQIQRAAEEGEKSETEDMYAFAPELDARSMLHERQRTRLYIS